VCGVIPFILDFTKVVSWTMALTAMRSDVQARAVEQVEKGLMQQAQRFFLLTQIDNIWKEHLQAMQFLRQAVGLRGELSVFRGVALMLETIICHTCKMLMLTKSAAGWCACNHSFSGLDAEVASYQSCDDFFWHV
jgi:hypothetical protein